MPFRKSSLVLLTISLLFSGCWVTNPLIDYKCPALQPLIKAFLAGEKLDLSQEALREYNVNGVLVELQLGYFEKAGNSPEASSLYNLTYSLITYSSDAKCEISYIDIPGVFEAPLRVAKTVYLPLIEESKALSVGKIHRVNGLHCAYASVHRSINGAALAAVQEKMGKVTVRMKITVTNNGRVEEREITYAFRQTKFYDF